MYVRMCGNRKENETETSWILWGNPYNVWNSLLVETEKDLLAGFAQIDVPLRVNKTEPLRNL